MNKLEKYLLPWKQYNQNEGGPWQSYVRQSITNGVWNKIQIFYIQIFYFKKNALYHIYNGFLGKYITYQGNGKNKTIEQIKDEADEILIKDGYILLSQEQYDKLKVLL
jgi:hypothetical protein